MKPFDMPGTFDTQPPNIGVGTETGYFFLQDHKVNDIIHPFFYRKIRVFEGIRRINICANSQAKQQGHTRKKPLFSFHFNIPLSP
jgi:hypothetical protein